MGEVLSGRYELLDLCAEGQQGTVYRARDTWTHATVAAKVFKEPPDPEGIRIWGDLHHPCIVELLDVSLGSSRPYVVMEFVRGLTLSEAYQAFGEPGLERIICDVCLALRVAHSRGICHGDIKSANILVEGEKGGSVVRGKLTDFGLWRSVGANTGGFGGTLAYAAPEVLRGDPRDTRADLYSLGATIYEILTGRPVFQGKDARAVVEAHLQVIPSDPAKLNPSISKDLSGLVLRLLEKEPTKRLGSADEVISLLGGDKDRYRDLGYPPWINRTRPLRFMERLLSAAEQGQGSVTFVIGDRGIGKTALLRRLAFDQGLHGRPRLFLSSKDEVMGRDAGNELVRRAESLAARSSPRLAQASYAHRFVVAVRAVADNGCLVVLVDDIDEADATLHELFGALVPLIATEPVVIVASCEKQNLPAVQEIMPDLFNLLHVRKVRLRSFTPSETNELLASLLCAEHVGADLASLIHRSSGGSPGFAQEAARQLVLRGHLRNEAGRWLTVALPESSSISDDIEQFIKERLNSLGTPERQVLGIAALYGAPVPEDLLRSILALDEPRLTAAIRSLLNLNLIVRRGCGWKLRQAYHADAATAVFSPAERASCHARLAEAIQSQRPADPAWLRLMVYHLMRAGRHAEAYENAIKSAQRTLEEKRYSRSLAFFDQAESCLDHFANQPRIQVLRGQAMCCLHLGHKARAIERFSRLFTDAGVEELPPQEQSKLRLAYAEALSADGHEDEARHQLQIVMTAPEPPDHVMIEVLAAAAMVAAQTRRWAEAADHARSAIELMKAIPRHPLRAQAENTFGVALMMQGMFDEARPHLEASYRLRDEAGAFLDAGRCALNLGILFRRVGQYDKAARWAALAKERYEVGGSAGGQAQAENMVGLVELAQGDAQGAAVAFERTVRCALATAQWRTAGLALTNLGRALRTVGERSQALIRLNEAMDLAKRKKDRSLAEIVASNLAGFFLSGGDIATAETWYTRSRALAEEVGNPVRIADNLRGLARLHREQGKLDQADRLINDVLRALEGCEDELSAFYSNCELAELRLAQGNVEDALVAIEIADRTGDQFGPREKTLARRIVGKAKVAAGADEEAATAFRECLELAEATGFPEDRASVRLEVGRWLLKAGPVAGFRAPERYLTQAQEGFLRLGIPKKAEEAEQLLTESISLAGTGVVAATADARKLASLYRMMTFLNAAERSNGLLDQVLDLAVHAVRGERGLIIFVDKENETLTVRAKTEMDGSTMADARRISESVVKQVAGIGQPIFSSDALNDIRFTEYESIRINRIACFMCVPLSVRGQTVGTIYVDSCNLSHRFTDEDVSYLIAFANSAAVAMENLRFREELEAENRYLQEQLKTAYSFETLVGDSPAMKTVFDAMAAVSRSSVTVVIQGETGTGKELVARAIHYNGPRAKGRFVPVNCSALPDTLLESELFGYTRGAFTGATKNTDGLFSLADGGTLFLDEITDMSSSLQAKLLRVLETGEVKPLGQPTFRTVDTRLLCATNKNLEQEMLLGRFREDLYYRLKVVSIHIPSLGERRQDIPLLAAHFLNKYSEQFDQRIRGFTEEALAFLCLRDWPGNVRELEHVIEAAVALCPGRVLDRDALWLAQGRSAQDIVSAPPGLSLKEARRSLERRYVTRALQESAWNVSAAARNLGMSRRQLQRLMRRYELGPGRPSVTNQK